MWVVPSRPISDEHQKELVMSGTADKVQGKIKQAAGDLTGDEKLQREGERDETAGKIKDGLGKAKDKLSDAVDSMKDKLNGD
jgi:uncharacterized protein YjbJ (UPF0337 family)